MAAFCPASSLGPARAPPRSRAAGAPRRDSANGGGSSSARRAPPPAAAPPSSSSDALPPTLEKATEALRAFCAAKDDEECSYLASVFEERITGAAHECTLEGESPQDCDQLERLVTLVASLGLQPSSLLNAAKRWEYLAVHAGDPKKAPPPPDPLKEQRRDILAAAFVREDSDGDGYVGVEKARQLLKLAGHEVRGHDAELAFSSLESRGTPDEDSFVTAIAEKDDDVALSSIEPQMSLDDLFFLDEHLFTGDASWLKEYSSSS